MSRDKETNQVRADKAVKLKYPTLTGRQIEEAFEGSLVRDLEGKALRKGDRLAVDSTLDCTGLDFHLRSLRRGNSRLVVPVVAQSDEWLVVDKPPGVPSHPLSLFDTDTITHWAINHYPEIVDKFPQVQPIIVPHRLDTGTSGLLIVARTQDAFLYWRKQFIEKKMSKKYLAWCWGVPDWNEKLIESPIAHDPSDRRRMEIALQGKRFRPPILQARSEVRVIRKEAVSGMTLCEVSCDTGVTHQVRVHLASVALPLVGDGLYDPKFNNRAIKPPFHLLRAFQLDHEEHHFILDVTEFHSLPS
jgi:23S rRNA pseudouridine1911/1915/1917 synthase